MKHLVSLPVVHNNNNTIPSLIARVDKSLIVIISWNDISTQI